PSGPGCSPAWPCSCPRRIAGPRRPAVAAGGRRSPRPAGARPCARSASLRFPFRELLRIDALGLLRRDGREGRVGVVVALLRPVAVLLGLADVALGVGGGLVLRRPGGGRGLLG